MKLLERAGLVCRRRGMSGRTAQAYCHWIRRFLTIAARGSAYVWGHETPRSETGLPPGDAAGVTATDHPVELTRRRPYLYPTLLEHGCPTPSPLYAGKRG